MVHWTRLGLRLHLGAGTSFLHLVHFLRRPHNSASHTNPVKHSHCILYYYYTLAHAQVAIKRMKRTCRTWRECASLRELQSLKALSSHPQIVALFEVIREADDNVYFVVRMRKNTCERREDVNASSYHIVHCNNCSIAV